MEKNRLIIALDVLSMERAVSLVKDLAGCSGIFKIGPVLFVRYGPRIVEMVKKCGAEVFLDLKLYDIPNTVANTVSAMAKMGVLMCTVHISGGRKMLSSASGAASGRTKLLGVTMLTSFSGVSPSAVVDMAQTAEEAGLSGVISSPLEAAAIRAKTGSGFIIACPGIRPGRADKGDQKRVSTPRDAVINGADYIIVGRPVTESKNPLNTAKKILSDISSL